jgi:hypothetical protein
MLSNSRRRLIKLGQAMLMDNTEDAGKGLAVIIRFLLKRIEFTKRPYVIYNLKQKIYNLNEYEMSGKKSPSTASIGQSITFIKTILNGKPPYYIRAVINEVIKNL